MSLGSHLYYILLFGVNLGRGIFYRGKNPPWEFREDKWQ